MGGFIATMEYKGDTLPIHQDSVTVDPLLKHFSNHSSITLQIIQALRSERAFINYKALLGKRRPSYVGHLAHWGLRLTFKRRPQITAIKLLFSGITVVVG